MMERNNLDLLGVKRANEKDSIPETDHLTELCKAGDKRRLCYPVFKTVRSYSIDKLTIGAQCILKNISCYTTTLNFGVLPLVEIDHVMR